MPPHQETAPPSGVARAGWSPSPVLARVLSWGTRVTVAIVIAGLALALAAGQRGGATLTPQHALDALARGKGTGILGIGLIVLIGTPVVREGTALILFARRGERVFAILASIVLALVAISLAIGAR